jgi:hypothetical protein
MTEPHIQEIQDAFKYIAGKVLVDELANEVRRLRAAIEEHRDSRYKLTICHGMTDKTLWAVLDEEPPCPSETKP